jgi:solute carrier family 25 uncoupling protein 8/9
MFRAFYKGFNASCLRLVSWNICLWLSYEQLKSLSMAHYANKPNLNQWL